MEDIKKLHIISKLVMLFIMTPFLWIIVQKNFAWLIGIFIFLIFLIFSIRSVLLKKVRPIDYAFISLGYLSAGILLFFAIILTLGTFGDIVSGASIPILWGLFLLGLWLFGILLIYYTFQSKKELKKKRLKQ